MSKPTLIQIIIGLLFAAAIALGIIQSGQNPYSGNKTVYKKVQHLPAQEGSLNDYFIKAKDLESNSPQETAAVFLAVGDIMLSRNVAQKIKDANDPLLPFSKMADVLKSTDFNFGNLESPITDSPVVGGHSMIFGAPTSTIDGLVNFNFKVLNLANNHALDQGLHGLNYTYQTLDQLGITHTGIGSNKNQAWQPAIINENGIKICFVGASYASVNDSGKTKNDYVARIEDLDLLKASIYKLKANCDFIVATMHAGTEYTHTPNKAQTTFAHAAIDFGADMVIGAHPHWVQTIERYCPLQSSPPNIGGVSAEGGRGGITKENLPPPSASQSTPPVPGGETATCPNPKYIFYSLGNFIFDQEWSKETKEGLTLKITLNKTGCHPGNPNAAEGYPGSSISNLDSGSQMHSAGMTQSTCGNDLQGPKMSSTLKQIELLPVIIENYSTPRPATPEETKKILQKIGETETVLK